ncbi:TetR/AcrR family transcriptional regulator [Actinoplanes teichomyceticus]|nr:TetR family transcriptional regulator [Actinoplanes teichomyceticus]
MGRVSQAQARQNRERIVATAARLFRERGVSGVSVADVSAAAGLTHGGFYKQFESKDALVAEAIEHAFAEQAARLRGAGETGRAAGTTGRAAGATGRAAGATGRAAGATGRAAPEGAEGSPEPGDPGGSLDARTVPEAAEGSPGRGDTDGSLDARARRAFVDAYLSAAHRDGPGAGCPSAGFAGDVARAAGGETARRAYADGVAAYARMLGRDGEPDLAAVSTMVGALLLARATAGTELSEQLLAAAREALG